MMSTELQPYTDHQIAVLKQIVGSTLTNTEFAFFLEVCKATQLNPFQRQIYAIKRGKGEESKMTIQIGIDGSRLIAERSGKYAGQLGPQWCGPDGKWRDVWLEKEPPAAARVGILRTDFKEPIWGIARYSSYVQSNNAIWAKMSDVMIAKCAESLALRKAFPALLSGLYTKEEMDQADAPDDAITVEATSVRIQEVHPEQTQPSPEEKKTELAQKVSVACKKHGITVEAFGKWYKELNYTSTEAALLNLENNAYAVSTIKQKYMSHPNIQETKEQLEQQTKGSDWEAVHAQTETTQPTKASLEAEIKAEREKFGLSEDTITRHMQASNLFPTADGLSKLLDSLKKPKTIITLFCKQHGISNEQYRKYCLDNETNGNGVYVAIQDDDRRQDIIDALKSYQPQEVSA